MKNEFWEHKDVKKIVFWIVFIIATLALFIFEGVKWGFSEANWLWLFLAAANLPEIIRFFAKLPEPPKIFTFMTAIPSVGALICYYISFTKAAQEERTKIAIIAFILILLWLVSDIIYGFLAKKKFKD